MSLGVMLALGAMVMATVTNAIQEYIANKQADSSLVWQYCVLVSIAAVVLGLTDGFIITIPTATAAMLLATTGIVGYAGIWLLFQSLRRLDLGITMVIASSYVFFGYFANRFLFPDIEQLVWQKVLVACIFFCVIACFLLHRDTVTHHIRVSWVLLYPLGTALCRTVFSTLLNVFMKGGYMTPLQSIFFTEGAILLIAVLHHLLLARRLPRKIPVVLGTGRLVRAYVARGLANFAMGVLGNMAYTLEAANTVNIVKLFSIVLSALFGYIFFKQLLSQKQLLLMSIAFGLLVVFVIL